MLKCLFVHGKKEQKKKTLVTVYELNVYFNNGHREIFTSSVSDAWDVFTKWFNRGKSPRYVMKCVNGEVCLNRHSINSYRIFSYEAEKAQ